MAEETVRQPHRHGIRVLEIDGRQDAQRWRMRSLATSRRSCRRGFDPNRSGRRPVSGRGTEPLAHTGPADRGGEQVVDGGLNGQLDVRGKPGSHPRRGGGVARA